MTTTFAPADLDATGSSGESTPISIHTAAASGSGASYPREFSPYIDMAMPADADLSAIAAASGIHNFTLAFVLSSGSGIGWQGVGTISDDTLANGTTILSQVQAMQAAGADVTISFGGAAGQEAALTATSAASLQAEYQSVIDRYHVHSLDFDIEGLAVGDQHSITLRDQALVGLKAANPGLIISYTLPVLPTGLTADGLNVLASAKHNGLAIDVVNIMAMDYGSAVDNGGQMGIDAIDAAIATESQIAALGLSAKLGVTPMIGVNDINSEVFSLADAQAPTSPPPTAAESPSSPTTSPRSSTSSMAAPRSRRRIHPHQPGPPRTWCSAAATAPMKSMTSATTRFWPHMRWDRWGAIGSLSAWAAFRSAVGPTCFCASRTAPARPDHSRSTTSATTTS